MKHPNNKIIKPCAIRQHAINIFAIIGYSINLDCCDAAFVAHEEDLKIIKQNTPSLDAAARVWLTKSETLN